MIKLAIVTLALGGCFFYESYPDNRPAPHIRKIEEAKLLDLKVNLGEQPGLCPGQQGQLFADATVQWPGAHPVQRTIGKDVDSLQPAAFSITGALVRGDADAHLIPDADIMKSVQGGFVVDITYTPQPSYKFHETFKPEYSCFSTFAVSGDAGGAGEDGGGGGTSNTKGVDGKPGRNGHNGGKGQSAGKVEAYVTEVSTPFYPKLLAVRANDTFFLAPANAPLTFSAIGGRGGKGGSGGRGGRGGEQDSYLEQRTTSDGGHESVRHGKGVGGNGGTGGNGGDGGDGGNGGTVHVTYDSSFPELADLVKTDVSGGSGGAAGNAGSGGEGGSGRGEKESKAGNAGGDGSGGREGREGQEGRAQVNAGAVASKFHELAGITLLAGEEGRKQR